MEQRAVKIIKLKNDLIINYADEIKAQLIDSLVDDNDYDIDISLINKIDVSGLQLLIGFYKDVKLQGKSVTCSGIFKSNFVQEVNRATFTNNVLVNGDDLCKFIEETI